MKKESTRPRGRPLSFDREQVLDAAVLVFWDKGYEGASLDDLTHAMGINRPSLYSKFGNKHDLFMSAIDRYIETITSTQLVPLMDASDIRQAISGYLRQVIECVASKDWPAGCLVVCVATEVSERDEIVRSKVSGLLEWAEELIANRIAEISPGEALVRVKDPKKLSRIVAVIAQGLASRARAGAAKDELLELVDDFLDVLF